ncbi:probable bifunctional dTTP/UTP pyrophosphatase/methyltransferase protein isoform X2 [Hippopotamus amphibius kiboko]|uniref:probable bifunctional dTTP/UTP pyrophosphatase/methyltransferase protein isoform X2 n=1 Tax=Hippopotamus amphibius kiboko TaxID=575201 RepID=UPI00259800A1|nr:probable bifunctional dTTP/UTP pyrophosphatase/methyltransferase protein isoform X2 [Hippopotamus amphibius kiboko]
MVLCPVIRKLQQQRVVLASASPRRQEILSNAGLRFEVVPSRFKEKLHKASFASPYAYAVETAKQKALEVAGRMHQKDLRAPDVVIGADTIVAAAGLILEKPVDKQDAYRMLSRLNGKEHSVFTGVAIVHCCSKGGQLDTEVWEFYEETVVKFSELSEELLWEYIDSGEPMDKAGGYGIQALGGMLVEYVRGDFLNVVGFPLNRFCKELVRLYSLPRPQGLQRLKHDSIPAVDSLEHLSDTEGGGAVLARSTGGGRGGEEAGGGRPQAPGTWDADLNGVTQSRPPFPTGLLELMDGFKASKALFTACKLKVFDVLRDQGPLEAVDVAREIDASAAGTEWLLDVCVTLGLLERTDRGYSNTQAATLHLVSDSEHSLHGLAEYNDAHVWGVFTRLGLAVRKEAEQGLGALGAMQEEHLAQDRPHHQSTEGTLRLMRAVHGLSKLTAHHVATAFDLSRFSSACDLGGCTGVLARELAQQYPHLQVTVFDLPEVIELAGGFHPVGRQTERIRFVPGDFFKDSLPEADLYILSRILHDWPDDKLHALLSRVSSSCTSGGGLLVAEAAPAEEEEEGAARGPRLRTLSAGRPRSPDEYRRLLQRHGFRDVQVARAGDLLRVALGARAAP